MGINESANVLRERAARHAGRCSRRDSRENGRGPSRRLLRRELPKVPSDVVRAFVERSSPRFAIAENPRKTSPKVRARH